MNEIYSLSEENQILVAKNLIDIDQNDGEIKIETIAFIGNWILTDHTEKCKTFYKVWDYVLKNYTPSKKLILFRSSKILPKNNSIKSFSSSYSTVTNFCLMNNHEFITIFDTNELNIPYYPIVDVLLKAKERGDKRISNHLYSYICEAEYITRFNNNVMESFKCL